MIELKCQCFGITRNEYAGMAIFRHDNLPHSKCFIKRKKEIQQPT